MTYLHSFLSRLRPLCKQGVIRKNLSRYLFVPVTVFSVLMACVVGNSVSVDALETYPGNIDLSQFLWSYAVSDDKSYVDCVFRIPCAGDVSVYPASGANNFPLTVYYDLSGGDDNDRPQIINYTQAFKPGLNSSGKTVATLHSRSVYDSGDYTVTMQMFPLLSRVRPQTYYSVGDVSDYMNASVAQGTYNGLSSFTIDHFYLPLSALPDNSLKFSVSYSFAIRWGDGSGLSWEQLSNDSFTATLYLINSQDSFTVVSPGYLSTQCSDFRSFWEQVNGVEAASADTLIIDGELFNTMYVRSFTESFVANTISGDFRSIFFGVWPTAWDNGVTELYMSGDVLGDNYICIPQDFYLSFRVTADFFKQYLGSIPVDNEDVYNKLDEISQQLIDLQNGTDEDYAKIELVNSSASSTADDLASAGDALDAAGDALDQIDGPDVDLESWVPTDVLSGQAFTDVVQVLSAVYSSPTVIGVFAFLGGFLLLGYLLFGKKD